MSRKAIELTRGKDLSPEFLAKMSDDEISNLLKESYAHKTPASDSKDIDLDDLTNSLEESIRQQRKYIQDSLNDIVTEGGSSQAAAVRPPKTMAEELAGRSGQGVIVNKTPDEINKMTDEERKKKDAEERAKILKEALDSLHKLTGLKSVKDQVLELQATIAAEQVRKKLGMLDKNDPESDDISVHLALLGAPGTGKTTVARIYAKILRGIGLLNKGQLVETDRSGLVAEYQGQTAPKTNKVIDSALDGVLFIDEAYNLNTGDQDTFGQEAIATLMKRMEDDRDRLVVIIAGYTDVTEHFLDSNPGLRSRFVEKIEFPNYMNDELVEIAVRKAKSKGVEISDANRKILTESFTKLRDTAAFANGRTARVLVDNAMKAQSLRFMDEMKKRPDMTEDEQKKFLGSLDDTDLLEAESKTIDMSTSKQSAESKMIDDKVRIAELFKHAGEDVSKKLHSDSNAVKELSAE
jgi:AAA+ superfamily predicted ATPase